MRSREKWAADQLLAFLKLAGHTACYTPGDDPPDATFVVDNESWAVEHTELHAYAEGGPHGEVADSGVHAWHFGIEDSLNSLTKGQRKCGWKLYLAGPLSAKHLDTIKRDAVRAINADDAQEFKWPRDMAMLIRIPDSREVGVASTISASTAVVPGSDCGVSNVGVVVDYAVKRALEEKVATLNRFTTWHKRVLLLDSAYKFADQSNVRDAITKCGDLAGYCDLIFLISRVAHLPDRIDYGVFVSRVGGSDGIETFGMSEQPVGVE